MSRTIPEIIFRNIFLRWSPFLNRTVQEETEHPTKEAAVFDIIDMELNGYNYSHSLYLADGQPRRTSLMIEVIMLEGERADAAAFVPQPPVGIPSIAA